ncbi:unnamed protein product [Brachionus calyciflorus]|uniref:Kinesin motor domain-containing protein n=1 Tax=Brachionus calyciflorus TaxID=104777 RepID=A0A814E0J8_9BILA|nr:unnamed protein product [Brachionus calyciflorus]
MQPEIYARIKPLEQRYVNCLTKNDNDLILTIHETNKFNTNKTLTYSFDKIFDSDSSQLDLLNEICIPIVDDLFDGINSLLITYGANKSGKKYTIYGNEQDNGILQACLYHLFQSIQTHKTEATIQNSYDSDSSSLYKKVPNTNWNQRVPYEQPKTTSPYTVQMSYVGLINNGFIDLLDSISPKTSQNSKKFNELEIQSIDEAVTLLRMGLDSHPNVISHRILTIKLLCHKNQRYSKLSIVDLAYQERMTLNQRDFEFIKSSIMALRNCFEILKENNNFLDKKVPYKESKLTWFLKNFFKEHSKIKMILCLNPSMDEFKQTCNVLKFASLKHDYEAHFGNVTSTPKPNSTLSFFNQKNSEYEKINPIESDQEIYEEPQSLNNKNLNCDLNKLIKYLVDIEKNDQVKIPDLICKKVNSLVMDLENYLGKETQGTVLNRRKSSVTTLANETESFTKVSTLKTTERNVEPIKTEMKRSQSVRCETEQKEITPKIRKISNQIKSSLRLSRHENFDFHNGIPVANRRGQKRSKSVEVWLDHKPSNLVNIDTLMQPLMLKKNSVKKLELKDTKRSSKYVLTHQQQDEYGEVVTNLIKGDIIKSPTGGSSVIFTDIERLQVKSPQLHRPRHHRSNNLLERNPFIIEDRCSIGIEGHPRLTRNKTYR